MILKWIQFHLQTFIEKMSSCSRRTWTFIVSRLACRVRICGAKILISICHESSVTSSAIPVERVWALIPEQASSGGRLQLRVPFLKVPDYNTIETFVIICLLLFIVVGHRTRSLEVILPVRVINWWLFDLFAFSFLVSVVLRGTSRWLFSLVHPRMLGASVGVSSFATVMSFSAQ